MRLTKYKCENGCNLPPRVKVLREYDDGHWGFGYHDPSFCPQCGEMMPYTHDKIMDFLDVYNIHPKLSDSIKLIKKSEFVSSAREAIITVEECLRTKSKLDLHGTNLVNQALSFNYDKQSQTFTKEPIIYINSLNTESERNEQEGLRYMLLGFVEGIRNIYQHNSIKSSVSYSVTTVIQASYFLYLLDGKGLTDKPKWLKCKLDYNYIYSKMPKAIDRLKLRIMMKRGIRK